MVSGKDGPSHSSSEVEKLLKQLSCLKCTEIVPLNEATGRVLREDLRADRDQPPFARVMMDGFAVDAQLQSSDGWFIEATQLAGDRRKRISGGGYCIEVMTGAILPELANAVVPLEAVEREGARVRLRKGEVVRANDFVHSQGSDASAGSVVLSAGRKLDCASIGLAGAVGCAEVRVTRQLKVGLLTTGQEVVPIGHPPQQHQVRASNAASARAALVTAGSDVETIHLPDSPGRLGRQLDQWVAEKDVIVSIGAISMGEEDHLPRLYSQRGTRLFHRVRQRPGYPMGAWQFREDCVAFGLPGNPASAHVCLHRYVLPWLDHFAGASWPAPLQVEILASGWPKIDPHSTRFVPVRTASGRAVPIRLSNSGDLINLAAADGFVEIPAGQDPAARQCLSYFAWR